MLGANKQGEKMEYLEIFYKVASTNFLIVFILLIIDGVTNFSNTGNSAYPNVIRKYAILTFLSVPATVAIKLISLMWMG